jgi:DNA-directed RNA polymerase subunit RPC12/RpoP
MRLRSVYVTSCNRCFRAIESETPEITCQNCGLTILIQWQPKEQK